MKNLLLLVACVFLFASSSAARKTSLQYAAEGSKHYLKGDYAKAIPPYISASAEMKSGK